MINNIRANEYLINNQVSLILLIFLYLFPSSLQHYLHVERMKVALKNFFITNQYLIKNQIFLIW